MVGAYLLFAMILLVIVIVGLIRVFIGPTRADRMLGSQLFGTTSVAMVLLLRFAFDKSYFYDMALVLAILAAISSIAFVRLTWSQTYLGENE